MKLEELEAKVRVLEDIEAIRKLKATYAYLVDTLNWPAMVNLFTDDGVADYGHLGYHKGKAELTKYFETMVPYSFMMHLCHNPIIEVKGEKATGKWYFEEAATHTKKNRAVWLAGTYEEEYVKVDGEWKIKTCVCKFFYNTPYDEGWVKTKMYDA